MAEINNQLQQQKFLQQQQNFEQQASALSRLGEKYSAKKNESITALSPEFDSNPEAAKKRMEETQQQFLNMLMTQLKLQDPTDPTDAGEVTQITSQLTLVQQSIAQTSKLQEIAQSLKNSNLDKASTYIGQEVYYDVGEKQLFVGANIDFEYTVEFDGDYSDPKEYSLKSNISITNEEGEVVFRTKSTTEGVKKHNNFLWNGKYIDPKTRKEVQLPHGKYRINIDAEIIDKKLKQDNGIKVQASTLKGGIVTKIKNVDGKPRLLVNNDLIDPEDIIEISSKQSKEKTDHAFADSLSYIGKRVSIEKNTLKVRGEYADIEFQNNIANHGNAMIKVLDPNNGDCVAIAFIDKNQIKEGKNYYSWHALKAMNKEDLANYYKYKNAPKEISDKYKLEVLQNGEYNYEVYIEDLNSNAYNKYTRQINKIEGKVTASEIRDGDIKLTIDGKEYSYKNVHRVEEGSEVSAMPLLSGSNNFLGKTLVYSNDFFNFDQKGELHIPFKLDAPHSYNYFGAELRIFDLNGRLVDVLKKDQDQIKFAGELPPPHYLQLNKTSKDLVNEVIKDKHFHTDAIYKTLSISDKQNVDSYINQIAPGKNYDTLVNSEKDRVEQYIKDNNLYPPFSFTKLSGLAIEEANKLVREEFGEMNYSHIKKAEEDKAKEFASKHYKGFYEQLPKAMKSRVDELIISKYINDFQFNNLTLEEKKAVYSRFSYNERAERFDALGLIDKAAIIEVLQKDFKFSFTPAIAEVDKLIEKNYTNVVSRVSDSQKQLVIDFLKGRFGENVLKNSYEETIAGLPGNYLETAKKFIENDLGVKISYNTLTPEEQRTVNRFINKNFATFPSYNTLSPEQKRQADSILQKHYAEFDLYTNLSKEHQNIITREIESNYYSGNYHDVEFDELNLEQQSLHKAQRKGENLFSWNGVKNKLTNERFPKGIYKYELSVMKGKNIEEARPEKIMVNEVGSGIIDEVKINGDEYIYVVQTPKGKQEIKQAQFLSIKDNDAAALNGVNSSKLFSNNVSGVLGKIITFDNNFIEYQKDSQSNVEFELKYDKETNYYGAELRIFDLEDKMLAVVEYPADKLKYEFQLKPPAYTSLNLDSRMRLNKFIIENYFNLDQKYTGMNATDKQLIDDIVEDLSPGKSFSILTVEEKDNLKNALLNETYFYSYLTTEQQAVVEELINKYYYEGKLHDDKFDSLSSEEKTLNVKQRLGRNIISWDGVKDESTQEKYPNGSYKYELYVKKGNNPETASLELIKQDNQGNGKVSEIKADNGEYHFVVETANGLRTIKEAQILAIKEPSFNPVEDVPLPGNIKQEIASLVNETLLQVEKQSTEMYIKRQQAYQGAQKTQAMNQDNAENSYSPIEAWM
ncbi:MAG: flgD [Rickettsiaceae bacterium]|jgi:flagellar basal-body rod modification protein FlgD|nr:flgD [Rickettsiaceae bacterium]